MRTRRMTSRRVAPKVYDKLWPVRPVAGPETLGRQAAYLRFVQRIAAEAVAAQLSPLEAALQADLGEFSQLHDPERLVGNLFRAMAEHDDAEPGAPLDFGAALDGMVKFRGGRPLHCMA